jgi:hypothetical protein
MLLWLSNHLTITSAPLRTLGRQEKLFDLSRLMQRRQVQECSLFFLILNRPQRFFRPVSEYSLNAFEG